LAKIKAHEVERAQKWAKMAKKQEKNGEVLHSFDWSPKVIEAFINADRNFLLLMHFEKVCEKSVQRHP
jgi:hypothetical protein